jgi:nucleotide-binding universal stress UspA family protein
MSFKIVFHPTDFSRGDEKAFLHALKISLAARGQISLLHVEPPQRKIDWNDFPHISPILDNWGISDGSSSSQKINKKRIQIKVQKVRKSGKEPRDILKYLEIHPADLVVLSTHQRGNITRLLHKAVAEPIGRKSGKMTLFVPRGMNGFVSKDGEVSLKNILIPIDHRPYSQQAFDATLELIHLFECPDVSITFLHVDGKDDDDIPSLNLPKNPDFNFEFTTSKGSVVSQILKKSKEIKADLIVMATQGHKGFLDALRGSTTEQVLRKARCPLFAIPQY